MDAPPLRPGAPFATPRSVRALIGPAPRTIADDVWAKLLWAGLNLDRGRPAGRPRADRARRTTRSTLVRALCGAVAVRRPARRRDRSACASAASAGRGRPRAPRRRDAARRRRLPARRPGPQDRHGAYTKPVDPASGDAIDAWEAVRPAPTAHPAIARPASAVDTAVRLAARSRSPTSYFNRALIPLLCGKAGVPRRGCARPHHQPPGARDDRQPALQRQGADDALRAAGVARPSLASRTQHYARITPNTLTKAYRRRRLLRPQRPRHRGAHRPRRGQQRRSRPRATPGSTTTSATATAPTAFFDQCPHRMACARCDFYVPKQSSRRSCSRRRTDLQRMLVEIPLTDDERAAVDGDRTRSTG